MEGGDLRDRLAVERTRLANERTLLAYVRTGLALSAAGGAVIHVLPAQALLRAAAWALVVAGVLTVAGGLSRFHRVRKNLQ
jgi:putative membrane protein